VAVCEPGRIIFEIEGVTEEIAKEALRLGASKLPGLMKFITRHDYVAE
jgi:large subunit ribosomal protein L16